MKKLINAFSTPFSFSAFIGLLFGLISFSLGTAGLNSKIESSQNDMSKLLHEAGHSLLLIQTTQGKAQEEALISQMLRDLVGHKNIFESTVKTASNIFFTEIKETDSKPNSDLIETKLPLLSPAGDLHGIVSIKHLPHGGLKIASLQIGLIFFSTSLAFLIGGFCYFIFTRRDQFLLQFEQAFNRIQTGDFETPLELNSLQPYGRIGEGINSVMDILKERDRMKHSLGRIMDPKIAEILIKENPQLGGLRRKATIMFCDIRNYTAICERLPVDELQEFLNTYWKGTVDIIMEEDGTIDKFHGDGVCVIFGAPTLHEDDPVRAVRTAQRLVENIEKMNKKREKLRKTPIQIGIGIHTGEVIAGNIGSEKRMDYTVVGDVVNVAARIEELNKKYGTKILISDEVYEQVEEHVRVKTLSLAHLRGHKRPILIHSLREFLFTKVTAEKKAA